MTSLEDLYDLCRKYGVSIGIRYISYAVFHNDDSGKGNDLRNTLLDDTGSLFDKGMTE